MTKNKTKTQHTIYVGNIYTHAHTNIDILFNNCPFLITLRYPLTFIFNIYHCVDTSASGLLVRQGDIRPVVSAAVELTWFITEIPK
jgi:hypothetical protein